MQLKDYIEYYVQGIRDKELKESMTHDFCQAFCLLKNEDISFYNMESIDEESKKTLEQLFNAKWQDLVWDWADEHSEEEKDYCAEAFGEEFDAEDEAFQRFADDFRSQAELAAEEVLNEYYDFKQNGLLTDTSHVFITETDLAPVAELFYSNKAESEHEEIEVYTEEYDGCLIRALLVSEYLEIPCVLSEKILEKYYEKNTYSYMKKLYEGYHRNLGDVSIERNAHDYEFIHAARLAGLAEAYEKELAEQGILPDLKEDNDIVIDLEINSYPRIAYMAENGDLRALEIKGELDALNE